MEGVGVSTSLVLSASSASCFKPVPSGHWEGGAVYRNSLRTNDASVHYPVTAPSCAAIVWASSFEVKSSLTVRMTALGGGGGGDSCCCSTLRDG